MDDRRHPPSPRRREGADDAAWGPLVPFLALLLALAYIPYASHQATVDATVDRESLRLRYVADRVTAWLGEEGLHLSALVEQTTEALAVRDPSRWGEVHEVTAAWDAVRALHSVDGLVIYDATGRPLHVRGMGGADDPLAGPGMAVVADLALRNPERIVADVWCGGMLGLNLALGAAVSDAAGRVSGAVVLNLGLERLLNRLIGIEARDLDVSFTLMTQRGDVLMHSGFGMRPAESSAGTCGGCHAQSLEGDGPVPASALQDRVEGVERLVVRSAVPFAGDHWLLWASTPMAEILRPLAQQQITSMLFTFLVVVVLVVGGMMLRRAQIRRIRLEARLRTKDRLLALAGEKERLQAELEGARRMATIGLMVSRVAHEVKNPLQYIGTGVDLLGATVQGEDAKGLVADLKTGVRTLDAIVKELLDFGRPMKVDRMPTQLNDLAREVVERVLPPGIEAALELDPGLPEVAVDPYKVRQVLENLVRNAAEALAARPEGSPPGRVVVATRRLQEGPLAGGAAIEVRDNGPGIPPEAVESIWDPFFTTKTRGTGLGLAVVRRIVEAHGGVVQVCGQPGAGACFEVRLGAPGEVS